MMEVDAIPPCARLRDVVEADNWNPGGAGTVTAIAVLEEMLPEVAVTVALTVPGVAVALALSVRLDVPLMVVVLKVPVTPLGSPVTDNVADPVKPFCGVKVRFVDAEAL
jgi:hypothetical protein